MITKEQISKALQMVAAVSATIHDLKEVPSGHLYAALMGKVNIEEYNAIIETIKGAGLIKVDRSHLITWIGPNLPRQ